MTPLHQFGEMLRQALAAIPLAAVRWMFLGLLAIVLIWVLLLPAHATRPAGSRRPTDDLKLWASLALLVQLAIYWFV